MNYLVNSDSTESGTITLNSNNKIVIVSENSSGWCREFGTTSKNVTPLRVLSDGIEPEIESNSNEMGDEGMPLDPKNVMMESEDSSQWSENLIVVSENRAALVASSDADITVTKIRSNSEKKEETENKSFIINVDESGHSMQESGNIQNVQKIKQSPTEMTVTELLRCRTCLNIVDQDECIPLDTIQPSQESLRDLLVYLLPQMASTVYEEDVVCQQCNTSIKFCVEFIDNCLKVETEVLNESEGDINSEIETKYLPEGNKRATLDHDYMVAGGSAQLKKEVEDPPMDTEEPGQVVENLLSNDDPSFASTEEYLFECFRCGKTFESEYGLDNHVRAEHGILKEINSEGIKEEERIYYKCGACQKLFATKAAYNAHVESSHPETLEPAKAKTHICKQCGNKFSYLGDLFEHRRKMHGFTNKMYSESPSSVTYVCEGCNKCFKSRKTLMNHVRNHDDGLFLCDECGRMFGTPQELLEHVEQDDHLPDIRIPCDMCNMAFLDVKKLNRHKQMRHGYVREYLCTVCNKNFSSKTSLDSHYRLKHAEVKPYQCERCGERFARLDYLRRHTNCGDASECKKFMKGTRRKFRYTKIDGEPVKCKLCGKVFKDVYLLKLHLTTHTNLRRFRCSVCNLTFTTNKNRERHEKIHDDPLSQFRCTVCWKRTQSQEELDNHILSHEKKYQCHICHESFARVYLLNYHVSEEHADDEDVEKEKQIVFTEGLKEYLIDYQ